MVYHVHSSRFLVSIQAASISKSLTAFMAVVAALGRHCAVARQKSRAPGCSVDCLLPLRLQVGPFRIASDLSSSAGVFKLMSSTDKSSLQSGLGTAEEPLEGPCSSRSETKYGPHVRFRDSCLTLALRDVLVRTL